MAELLQHARAQSIAAHSRVKASPEGSPARAAALASVRYWEARAAMLRAVAGECRQ